MKDIALYWDKPKKQYCTNDYYLIYARTTYNIIYNIQIARLGE